MKTSQRGIDLIRELEGFSAKPYLCPAGKSTIGYGHAIQPGELFERISQEEAEALLIKDIKWAETAVNTQVESDLTQNQFDALVSFVYNIGANAFRLSTMLRLLNSGDYNGAARQFSRWINSNGKPLNGLVRRRQMERALFEDKNDSDN